MPKAFRSCRGDRTHREFSVPVREGGTGSVRSVYSRGGKAEVVLELT